MRETKVPLRVFIILSLLAVLSLSSCGWRRMAVERHQQTQEIKRLEIERRQLELDCLKRKQAEPLVDCSQFQQSANPKPATPPPASATPASPAPAIPTPVTPTPAPPIPEPPTPATPAP
jgi:hypothetical protein